MKAQKLTLENVMVAIEKAEARWYTNRKSETIAKGIEKSADLAKARKYFTAALVDYVNANLKGCELTAGDFLSAIESTLSTKATMRMGQFFSALHAGNYSELDGVTALEILSAAFAGAQSREAVFFAATGKGNEHTSDQVKNIALVRKLQKALKGKTVGSSTEGTQNSRSFGKGGFCNALNMGKMTKDQHGQKILAVNQNNPFFVQLATMIEKASDSTLELMKGAKAEA